MHRERPGAAENLVFETIAALDERSASSIVTDDDQCKELIEKLLRKLEPAELWKIASDHMRLWKKEQKEDLRYSTNTISTLAAQSNTVQSGKLKQKRRHTHMRDSGGHDAKTEEPERMKLRRDSRARKHGNSIYRAVEKKPTEKFEAEEWDKPCMNTEECSGIHPFSKCPITTKEKRRELLDEHFGRKKGNKNTKAAVLRSPSELTPNTEKGRYRILLHDTEAVGLGDSGADYSKIPSDTFEKISAKDPGLSRKLDKVHTTLETALTAENWQLSVTASRRVSLDLTIVLPQTRLPVRIRGLKFLIGDTEMPEIL